jgi:hypothetical protein
VVCAFWLLLMAVPPFAVGLQLPLAQPAITSCCLQGRKDNMQGKCMERHSLTIFHNTVDCLRVSMQVSGMYMYNCLWTVEYIKSCNLLLMLHGLTLKHLSKPPPVQPGQTKPSGKTVIVACLRVGRDVRLLMTPQSLSIQSC